MPEFIRISVPCRSCRGDGFYDTWVDDDGQGHLNKCRLCYRGQITLKLTRADVLRLISDAQLALERQ